jgi:hypothetical protein
MPVATSDHPGPVPGTPASRPGRRRPGVSGEHRHYKWWALSCTSLGMLLATLNSGTLIIALPDLERSLHTSLLQLVWVILAYMIASTVLVLSAGRLSDLFGRKRAYVGGFVVFGLASLGAGFSDTGTVLILWRIVQGIGGAFLFANSAALVTDAFPKRQLGLAMGRTRWWPPSGSCSARSWVEPWCRSRGPGCSGSTSRWPWPARSGRRSCSMSSPAWTRCAGSISPASAPSWPGSPGWCSESRAAGSRAGATRS